MRQGNINSLLLRKRNSIHFCENRKTLKYEEKIFLSFSVIAWKIEIKKMHHQCKKFKYPLANKVAWFLLHILHVNRPPATNGTKEKLKKIVNYKYVDRRTVQSYKPVLHKHCSIIIPSDTEPVFVHVYGARESEESIPPAGNRFPLTSVSPPPGSKGGGGHTRLQVSEWGGGGLNSDDWKKPRARIWKTLMDPRNRFRQAGNRFLGFLKRFTNTGSLLCLLCAVPYNTLPIAQ